MECKWTGPGHFPWCISPCILKGGHTNSLFMLPVQCDTVAARAAFVFAAHLRLEVTRFLMVHVQVPTRVC